MLSPARMMRLSAVVLEKDALPALRRLGELGAVELIRSEAGPDTAPLPPPDTAAYIARCSGLQARAAELRKALDLPRSFGPRTADQYTGRKFIVQVGEPKGRGESSSSGPGAADLNTGRKFAIKVGEPKGPGKPAGMTFEAAEAGLDAWEGRTVGLLKRRRELRTRLGGVSAVIEQVSGYRDADIPTDQAGISPYLRFVIGSLPAANMEALERSLSEDVLLSPLPERNGRRPLIVMASAASGQGLDKVLKEAGFQPAELPVSSGGTLAGLYEENRREEETVSAEIRRADSAVQALAEEAAGPLAEIESAAGSELSLHEARGYFLRTEAAALLTGWVPAEYADGILESLKTLTGGRCAVSAVAPLKTEEKNVPVLLRPHRLLRPFVALVEAYGLPKYGELEPTLFAAVSWVLMFGMMFGDAGQGAVLALAGLFVMRSNRPENTRRLGTMLFYAGLSGMVFGAVYGSYFGLPALRKYALWRDPLEGDMMVLMLAAVKAGIAMISLGMILNIVNRFRRGDALGGVFDKFGVSGLVFYWGSLYIFARYAALQAGGLLKWAVPAFIVLPVFCWAAKEPIQYFLDRRSGHAGESEGLGVAAAQSLVEAFEAVFLYLANTISFVRLAAYAVSHAALMMAAFMMAAEMKRLCGGSAVAGVLVVIFGNAVALVLEGTVAAVQALRLEYYEFFGKFFTGGGRAFKPFSLISEKV